MMYWASLLFGSIDRDRELGVVVRARGRGRGRLFDSYLSLDPLSTGIKYLENVVSVVATLFDLIAALAYYLESTKLLTSFDFFR